MPITHPSQPQARPASVISTAASHSPLIALHRLVLILDEFRKIAPEMPLQQAITLLTVAAHPGETVSEVARLSGNTLSSTSRHIEFFGPRNTAKDLGLEMVVYDYSAVDRRKKVVVMTPKGQRTVNSLIDLINRT